MNTRIKVNLIEGIPVKFHVKETQELNEAIRELYFDFYLSPTNEVGNTTFIIEIINRILKQQDEILIFQTKFIYELTNFSLSPNLAILEDIVFEAFNHHLRMFIELIQNVPPFQTETIRQLLLEQFEETLKQKFNKSFPDI